VNSSQNGALLAHRCSLHELTEPGTPCREIHTGYDGPTPATPASDRWMQARQTLAIMRIGESRDNTQIT
jgi:hypothetical protein